MAKKHLHGFALLELSIVLAVVGLIIGGILVGDSLRRAAGLRKIGTAVETYRIAAQTFRSKYGCTPGDCPNATSIFGIDGVGVCPMARGSWADHDIYYSGTCDGDNNGQIDYPGESFLFWQHLALAELIEGKYTGIMDSGATLHPGLNAPVISYNDLLGSAFPAYNPAAAPIWLVGGGFVPAQSIANQNVFLVGGNGGGPNPLSFPLFSPMDARVLDMKFDDGLPITGAIVARYNRFMADCADDQANAYNASDAFTPSLDLNNPTHGCGLVFLTGL